jgi:hypothetical protein
MKGDQMKHDAQIEIVEKLNKKGELYKVMCIYVNDLLIHEVYIKDSLNQIIEYVLETIQKK